MHFSPVFYKIGVYGKSLEFYQRPKIGYSKIERGNMNILTSKELDLIKAEYAPNGQCKCSAFPEELGCPYCNPQLRQAWRKSQSIEKQMNHFQILE